MWLNEYDVEDALIRYAQHPVLGPATRTLSNLVNWTNSNSDGWPYWQAPSKASAKLQDLVHNHRLWERGEYQHPRPGAEATKEAYALALRPLKAFRTRWSDKGLFIIVLPDGSLDPTPPPPPPCVPHATCGHRVRWTGVIEDGELIAGTGCWVHITDEAGNPQPQRVAVTA